MNPLDQIFATANAIVADRVALYQMLVPKRSAVTIGRLRPNRDARSPFRASTGEQLDALAWIYGTARLPVRPIPGKLYREPDSRLRRRAKAIATGIGR